MAGENVNLNQGIDFINKYLKDLGINKTVTSSEVTSIFNDLEKNEDGTVDTTEFALAVANAYGDNTLTELEDEYLKAWEDFAAADGNNASVSVTDLASLDSSSETGSGENVGSSDGTNGGGTVNPQTSDNEITSNVAPANITGNESSSELEASRSEALAQLSEAQSQKANNEEIQAAQAAVDEAKLAYDAALEAFKENEAELFEQIEELNTQKEEKDAAVDEKKSAIDEVKSNISEKESAISDAQGELNSLVEPNKADYAEEDEDGNVTYPGYDEAVAEYEAQKQALEEQIAALEDELTDLQTQLAAEEEALAQLEQEALDIDQQIFDAMQSEEMVNSEYAQAVSDSCEAYYAAKDNLIEVENQQAAQLDADIAQLRENITAYDTAIDEAREREAEEEKPTEEVQPDEGEPENKEECEVDPIGLKGEKDVTYDFIKDDGDFDTVSDLLGSSDLGITELTNLNTDGDDVITGEELAAGNIKVVRTDAEGNQTVVDIAELEKELGGNISIDISSIKEETSENQEFSVNVVNDAGEVIKAHDGYSTYEDSADLAAKYGIENDIKEAEETYESLSDFYEELQGKGDGGYSQAEWEELMDKDYGNSYALRGLIDIVGSVYGEDSEIYQILDEMPSKMSINLKNCEEYISVNDKDNETEPAVGDIVFTDEADGSNPHSGIIVDIKYDDDGNATYVVAEANSAKSSGGHGVALREYNLGGSGKAIRGFIPNEQERSKEQESNLPAGWSVDDNGIVKDEEGNSLLAVDYDKIEENGWNVDDNGIIKDADGNEIGRAVTTSQDVDDDGVNDDVDSYYMYAHAINEEEISDNGYTVENGVIKDADGNEIGRAVTTSKDTDGDGVDDDITSYYLYGKTEPEETPNSDENPEESGEHAVSSTELKENYPGYTISDNKILDADGNEIGRTEETIEDISGDGFTDKITKYYLYDEVPLQEPAADPETPEEVPAQEPAAESETPEETELSEKIDALASEDEAVAKAAWDELNITEETSVDELVELATAYDEIHGEGAFLAKAEEIFGTSPYDSIMDKIKEGDAEAAANADENTVLSDGTRVGEVVNRLANDDTAWTEEYFESLTSDDLAVLSEYWGADNFKAAVEKYFPKTEFSIINEKLSELPTLTSGNEPDDSEDVWSTEITDPEALKYVDQLAEIEANIAELKEVGMDSWVYEEQEKISGLLDEALNDESVSIEDKMKIMVGIAEQYQDIVTSYLSRFEYPNDSYNTVISMVEQCETVEEIAMMSDAFAQIYGEGSSANSLSGYICSNLSNNSEAAVNFANAVIKLYENATPEEMAKLNTVLDTAATIQYLLSGEEETAALTSLMNTISANLPDDASAYTDLEDWQLEAYKDAYPSVNSILNAVADNKIDQGTGLYLLMELSGGDMTSLVSDFRSLSAGKQEDYLPLILDMFAQDFEVNNNADDNEQSEPISGLNSETATEYATQLSDAMERIKWYEENGIYPSDYSEQKEQLNELLTDALNDETVSVQDKITILDKIAEENSEMVLQYLSRFEYPYESYNSIINMVSECESVDDLLSLSKLFGKIYGEGSSANSLSGYICSNLSTNSEAAVNFANAVIKLYENATPEEIAKLNAELDTAATIQYLLSGEEETAALTSLMTALAKDLPDDVSVYTDLRDTTIEYYQKQYSSLESLLRAVKSGDIDSKLGLYLIKEKYNGNMESLVSDFRNMGWFHAHEEEYLPVLLSLFENEFLGTES